MIVAFRNVIIEKTIFSSEYFLNISQFYFSDFSLRTVTNLCDCHIDWFHSWWYLLFTYLTFQVSLKNLLVDRHLNLQKSILIRKNNIHEKVIITTKSEIENKSEFLKSRFRFFISQVCKKKKRFTLTDLFDQVVFFYMTDKDAHGRNHREYESLETLGFRTKQIELFDSWLQLLFVLLIRFTLKCQMFLLHVFRDVSPVSQQ